jgi:F5/8 type C domain
VQDTTACTTNIPISGVTASANDGNVPQNVLDNNLATRWSSNGIGQFITSDLGSIQNICSVDIAWYNGNMRQYHFVIATSTDGTTFSNKFSGDSSGTTLNSEKYVIPATDARYVRITVNGNTANNWASITELDIFGSAFSPATSLYEYAPSLSLSGPGQQHYK